MNKKAKYKNIQNIQEFKNPQQERAAFSRKFNRHRRILFSPWAEKNHGAPSIASPQLVFRWGKIQFSYPEQLESTGVCSAYNLY